MMPNSPATFSPAPGSGRNPLIAILIVVLALGAVGFGVMAVVSFGKASRATSTLESQKKAAAAAARDEQKKADQTAYELASESPYRSYVAPIEYGSYEIKFPKTWSADVAESRSGSVQVSLVVNPDFVKMQNNVADLAAAKITLNQRTLSEFTKTYTTQKTLKKSDITVAGIPSVQFIGDFSDKRTKRLVAVPVRDKTLVFINENPTYSGQFDEILAQSRVNP